MEADLVLVNVGQLVGVTHSGARLVRPATPGDFAVMTGAALVVHKGQIVWIGPGDALPEVKPGCTFPRCRWSGCHSRARQPTVTHHDLCRATVLRGSSAGGLLRDVCGKSQSEEAASNTTESRVRHRQQHRTGRLGLEVACTCSFQQAESPQSKSGPGYGLNLVDELRSLSGTSSPRWVDEGRGNSSRHSWRASSSPRSLRTTEPGYLRFIMQEMLSSG